MYRRCLLESGQGCDVTGLFADPMHNWLEYHYAKVLQDQCQCRYLHAKLIAEVNLAVGFNFSILLMRVFVPFSRQSAH